MREPLYQAAEAAYLSQDYALAVQTYSRFLQSRPLSPYASDACYGRGMAYLQLNDGVRAEADFQKALENPRDKTLHGQALYHLGQAAGMCGHFANAEAAYKKLLKECPSAFPADEVLYSLGLACMRQGRWDESDGYFRRIVRQFPRSPRWSLAEEKLSNRDRFFSVQAGPENTSRSAAESAQRRMAAAGFSETSIRTVVRQGLTYYCVRTGGFRTWEAAREYRNRLAAFWRFTDAVVVP